RGRLRHRRVARPGGLNQADVLLRRSRRGWRTYRVGQVAHESPAVGDLDERGAVALERLADGRRDLFRAARLPSGNAIRGGEPEEVGVVEVGVDVTALVSAVLDVLDRAQGRVVVHDCDAPEPISRRRG